ncbi:ATP-binding protein [Roseateles cellulosilyticus]|uniref:AAA family ATPase n=1 Tax=Pelomonas cellulosilytica TaxID=2906762 RepID=A0ABS8Y020_9BURK|nr:YhaN family protein [Pelomonas sp. P8]MCE4555015.1 AAA family ATPase [Pelomonas sp. P8]
MRLQNLNLVRFGKFTDRDITLPHAEHDFHFIVGPNEAGKSTLRGAIADLLFGFPTRYQSMAFLHPQADLRLAATVSEGGQHLSFIRTKGNKNTLRAVDDSPLQPNALEPFMGQADRAFFESMFGLSHEQLVKGGAAILNASEDVSQVLFQSAAGIAGLGKVREALNGEADKLWSPHKSKARTFYIAEALYDEAGKQVKTASVRSKNWGDARAALDAVEVRIAEATGRKGSLQASRLKLERIRRLAPMVVELKQMLAELATLGPVSDLPANASETLATGEQEHSVAQTTLAQCEMVVTGLTKQRNEVTFDKAILASKDDIEGLSAFGESVRNHYAGLLARQAEVDRSLERARSAASDLGWSDSEDEAALRARLPGQLAIRDVLRLVNEHGALLQSKTSTAQAVENKKLDLADVKAELSELVVSDVPPALRGALAEAQGFRNSSAAQLKLETAVNAAQRALETAEAGLGRWKRAVDALRQMSPPSAEGLAALVVKRNKLDSELAGAVDRAEQAQDDFDDAELAVRQFAQARHIVTSTDVRAARENRDAEWQSIKQGATPLPAGASGLDAAIALADELVDSQLDSATEAAELQSLKQQVERVERERLAATRARDRKRAELSSFDQEWQETTAALDLPGLPLLDAGAWMVKRELVLSTQSTVLERTEDLQQEQEAAKAASALLAAQLALAKVNVPPGSKVPALIQLAEDLVAKIDNAAARRGQLVRQREGGAAALARLQAAADAARQAYEAWEKRWHEAMASAGLSQYVKSVEDAEQAVSNINTIKDSLDKATATRRERIDTMNRDLDEFKRLAEEVVDRLEADDLRGVDPKEVVRTLMPRLKDAEAGEARREAAEQALAAAMERRDSAQEQVEKAKAKVAPLLAAAGVQSLADLAPLVDRSDTKRRLSSQIELARAALTKDAGGLTLDQLVAETEGANLDQVAIDLTSAEDGIEQIQDEQTRLAVERTHAKQVMDGFGGGRDAADAEARKQEALAAMADASERYIKVAAATKLLSWAIERYREQNQGPLLTRASLIFSTLTLGQFTRLLVDYDGESPRLTALRNDGKPVEVPGLSEGTRDQLYLALRMAALEVHLSKAKPLPFIVDDLFINFDDERSTAGLAALRELSKQTQVLFLSHHDHLLPHVQQVFGTAVNVVRLSR